MVADNLWCQIQRSSDEGVALGVALQADGAPEIDELEEALVADHYVLWLDVPVHDLAFVHLPQGFQRRRAKLPHELYFGRQRRVVHDQRLQVLPADLLCQEHEPFLVFQGAVLLEDERVIQLHEDFFFSNNAASQIQVFYLVLRYDFHALKSPGQLLRDQIDAAERAFAELSDHHEIFEVGIPVLLLYPLLQIVVHVLVNNFDEFVLHDLVEIDFGVTYDVGTAVFFVENGPLSELVTLVELAYELAVDLAAQYTRQDDEQRVSRVALVEHHLVARQCLDRGHLCHLVHFPRFQVFEQIGGLQERSNFFCILRRSS